MSAARSRSDTGQLRQSGLRQSASAMPEFERFRSKGAKFGDLGANHAARGALMGVILGAIIWAAVIVVLL
jgi:hypothetical protein